MTLSEPLALLGLLTLPVLWWLHVRRSKPEVVPLPALFFFLDEDERAHRPRKRQLDLPIVLALLAAASLALAAAGPAVGGGEAGRRVRVVVAGGAPAFAKGYRERVNALLDRLMETTSDADRVEVVWEPAPAADARFQPRPSLDALLAAARASPAAVRVIVSDDLPSDETGAVRWVAVGSPAARNVGIVSASVAPDGLVSLTVGSDAPEAVDVRVSLLQTGHDLERDWRADSDLTIPANGFAAASFVATLAGRNTLLRVAVRTPGFEDALAADDAVELDARPVVLELDSRLPPALESAVRRGFEAVVGAVAPGDAAGARIVRVWRRVVGEAVPPGAEVTLVLEPVVAGTPATRAEGTSEIVVDDPLTRDLGAAGVQWVYAPDAARVGGDERLLLGVQGRRTWPVVLRGPAGVVRLAPDPTRGTPPAVETPFWPLFLENLLGGTRAGAGGVRLVGLLDAASSRLGKVQAPFEPSWLDGVAPDLAPAAMRLRTPLVVIAGLALLLLWGLPTWKRLTARRLAALRPMPARTRTARSS